MQFIQLFSRPVSAKWYGRKICTEPLVLSPAICMALGESFNFKKFCFLPLFKKIQN
jgi:hypothetical protein